MRYILLTCLVILSRVFDILLSQFKANNKHVFCHSKVKKLPIFCKHLTM